MYVEQRKIENSLIVPTDFNRNSQAVVDSLFATLGKNRTIGFERLKQMEFILLQYDTCPFCGKVKAFMDVHGIPYRTVEVDPFTKTELKKLAYKRVPVLQIGETNPTYLVDSTEIVNVLAPVVNAKLNPEILKWRKWNTEIFMRYVVLSINRSIGDTLENYRYIQSREKLSFGLKLKYLTAGAAMFLAAHITVKKNLKNALGRELGDIRKEMNDELGKWMEQIGEKPFHGGKTPDIADTDVFGILLALKGHKVYRDIASNPVAANWISNMEASIAKNARRL
jgi:microsomal prostaglandin-E synthase 2